MSTGKHFYIILAPAAVQRALLDVGSRRGEKQETNKLCGDKTKKASSDGQIRSKLLRPLLPPAARASSIHPSHSPSFPLRHGAHAQPGRDLPPRRRRQARHRRRHAKPPLHHHQHHHQGEKRAQGGGDGGHPGRLRRAGPVPGGDREQLRGEDAGQRGHAAPHPHPDPLRALPLPRPPRRRPGAALRGGRPQAALQGGRLAAPLPQQGRLRRAQARVPLEGPRPGLRRRARRQDQQGARRRRPCPRGAPVRGAQPSQGPALHALRRRAERQRLHHRREDRPDQDQRSSPEEEGLGMLMATAHGVLFLFLCIAYIHSFVSCKVCSSTASV